MDLLIFQIVTTLILFVTMIIMIFTFSAAHLPCVGITRAIPTYNQQQNELKFELLNKNSGTVPASNNSFNIKLYEDDKKVELEESQITDSHLIFPNETTSGGGKFINVTKDSLKIVKYTIECEITYEHKIVKCLKRCFTTKQKLLFNNKEMNFLYVEGYVIKKLSFR